MEETYERAAARALGKYGEETAGAVQPTVRMLQIWKQEAILPNSPRYLVLYEKHGHWRKVPDGLLMNALQELDPIKVVNERGLGIDLHATLQLAMEITNGALQLLQVVDELLTKAGQ